MLYVDTATHRLYYETQSFPCAIGKHGATSDKQEGDGKTPLGTFPLRKICYRADRLTLPPLHASFHPTTITQEMGWCDDPTHPAYNLPVTLPFAASHETLWREDHRYDIIIPLGYNDAPPVAGKGSAIFFHLTEDYSGTEGCVALTQGDLFFLLPHLVQGMLMRIG